MLIMPGCIFTAIGSDFDVDAFLATSPWRGFAEPFHRGEATPYAVRPVCTYSGFQIHISDLDEDELEPQIQDSLEFIGLASVELKRLAAFAGVETMVFDIGLVWKDTFYQSHSLPPEFLRLAGEHGLTVELSVYGSTQSIKPVA
jgi:hypothetical protein